MAALLAAHAAPAHAAPPSRCPTCRGPVWSWSTVPIFFHSSEPGGPRGGFTDLELDTIARFPMVTIEKWQGADVRPYLWEEDAWVVAAAQVKRRSPNTTVVVWFDSLRIYTANKTLNPDITQACTTGHLRASQFLETHSSYLLKNTSGAPALDPWSGCHIIDHTNARARAFWTEMCLDMTTSGVVDGCGADASWQNGIDQDWGLSAETARAWDSGHRQMMRETTAALGNGVLLGKFAWEVGDYVNGALHETCDATNETVTTLRNLTATAATLGRRLIYQCHGGCTIDELAAFLAGAGPYHYYGCGDWVGAGAHANFSEHWMEGAFGRPLGAPLADAAYADGVWTRAFASGTAVSFDTRTGRGAIKWADRF